MRNLAEQMALSNSYLTDQIISKFNDIPERSFTLGDLNPYPYGSKEYEYRQHEIEEAYRPK